MTTPWKTLKIEDLVRSGEAELKTGPFGTQLHASDYVEAGTAVINVRNIGFGDIKPDKLEYIADDTVMRLSSHLLRCQDIVFGRKGAVERHVFIRDKQSSWFQGSDCLRLRLNSSSVEPQFVSYHCLTEIHKAWIMSQCSHGATMASLNQDIIGRIELRLPPLSTQRKIAAVLSTYDDLIENNTRRIQILEEMAQALYREWFVHFRFPGHETSGMVESEMGLIPEGWKPVPIITAADVLRGRSYKGTELVDQGGVPFLNLKCIARDGGFRYDGVKRYAGSFKDTQTAKAGDIIMAVTDMTQERRLVARAARVPKLSEIQAVFSMDLVKVAPKADISGEYLLGTLRYTNFADEVKQHANGANVLHLNPERIEAFLFPLAPLPFRDLFAFHARPMFAECDVLEQKNQCLRQTRDLLLPKLISGEVDVAELDIVTKEAV